MPNYNSGLVETKQDIPEFTFDIPKPDTHVWITYDFTTEAPRWLVNLYHRAATTLPIKQLDIIFPSYQCNDMSLVFEVLNKCVRTIPIDETAMLGTKYKVNVKIGIDNVRYLTTADFQHVSGQPALFNKNIYLARLNMGTELQFEMEVTETTPQQREVAAMFHQFTFCNQKMQDAINEINSAPEFKKSIDKLNELQANRHKMDVPPFRVRIMTNGNYRLPYIIQNAKKHILETYNFIDSEFDKLELDHELLDNPGYFKYQISIPEDIAVYSGAIVSFLESEDRQLEISKNITIVVTYNRNNKNSTYKIIANANLEEVKKIMHDLITAIKSEVMLFDF